MASLTRYVGVLRTLNGRSRIKRKYVSQITFNKHLSTTSYLEKNSYIHNIGEQPLKYMTIGSCLEESANRWPDRPWIISSEENKIMTFSQVLEEADKLAAGFLLTGLQPGDKVGLCSPNNYKWVTTMMAVARAGLVLVTINPAYQEGELEYCLNKAGIKCLLIPTEFKSQKYYNMIRNMAPEIDKSMPGSLKCSRIPSLQSVVILDNNKLPGTFTYNGILSMPDNTAIQQISSMQSLIQPDYGCNIQFTSGTTGKPKAAYLSHFNFVNNSFLIGKRNQLSDKHHTICTTVPLFHAYGVVIVVMPSLQHGSTMVLPSSTYNPDESLKSIVKENCTVITGTPTMYVDLLNRKKHLNVELKTPEIAIAGGSPCSPQLFQQIKNELKISKLKSVFGMTETTAVIFQSLRDETDLQATDTVGHVQEHIEVQVVGEDGKVVPFGTPGELWIRGYSNMLEYLNDEEKTREIMGSDKWLKTGDKFILYEDGYGKVVGRLKDVIIRGGENVFPKEIEDYLNTHPSVLESQVFGVNDERLGEEIYATVRLREGEKLNYEEMKKFCKGKLAHFKIPRYLKSVDSFPKTASGKIQKFKLREKFENEK